MVAEPYIDGKVDQTLAEILITMVRQVRLGAVHGRGIPGSGTRERVPRFCEGCLADDRGRAGSSAAWACTASAKC